MDKGSSNTVWFKPLPGRTPREKVADMIGKVVYVPGDVFAVDVPGLVYRATVVGPDNSHKDAAIVKLIDDKRRFYFPLGQVREWFEATQLRHAASDIPLDEQPTTSDQSDQFAAEILLSLHQDEAAVAAPRRKRYSNGEVKATSMQADSTQTTAKDATPPPPQSSSKQCPPVYTAQATASAVLAAFQLGYRIAMNLQSGAGMIVPAL